MFKIVPNIIHCPLCPVFCETQNDNIQKLIMKKEKELCHNILENTVGKGEVASYGQFLILPRICTADTKKKNKACLGKGYLQKNDRLHKVSTASFPFQTAWRPVRVAQW